MRKNLFMILVASNFLFACTGGSGSNGNPAPTSNDTVQAKSINGPTLEGSWVSDCMADPFAISSKRQLQLKINGSGFEYDVVKYSDDSCKNQSQVDAVQGTFIFVKKTDDVFLMQDTETKKMNGATAQLRWLQNVHLADDTLYVSEIGADESVISPHPENALHHVGGSAPPPASSHAGDSPVGPQSGYYESETGTLCGMSVSTQSVNGAVNEIYADLGDDCSGSLQFACGKTSCQTEDGGITLTYISDHSFKIDTGSKSDVYLMH